MQFQPFEPGIEVFGPSIDAILEGFTLFPNLAMEKLARRGIGEICEEHGKPEIVIDRNRWYSQANWLSAFEDIARAVGSQVMYKIGSQVPKHAPFPPTLTDIHTGIAGIDVAYHMNHRKDGQVMFNPESGRMMEGIGHYRYERSAAQRILVHCKNPYPCDFDRGLLQAMAVRFEGRAEVIHDKRGGCRKRGEDSCTYEIIW